MSKDTKMYLKRKEEKAAFPKGLLRGCPKGFLRTSHPPSSQSPGGGLG